MQAVAGAGECFQPAGSRDRCTSTDPTRPLRLGPGRVVQQQDPKGLPGVVQPARHLAPVSSNAATGGSREQVANHVREVAQAGRALGHHPSQRPGRHQRAEHVRKELGGPVDRQVLVDQQVAPSARIPGSYWAGLRTSAGESGRPSRPRRCSGGVRLDAR
jgi:hypothetical protein